MRLSRASLTLLCWLSAAAVLAQSRGRYPVSPDSRPQPGVPKGEVMHFTFDRSRIFPGTFQDYWVYVPAQYVPGTPACLWVNQDGIQFDAPTVFDNLIARKEIPVTIGVFIMHGRVKAADPSAALDRFNRSYEYDGLGDNYVRFLLNELLPDVETRKASDGRPVRLSKDPNDRAIGGTSSGAIAAFTAAWERPDTFRRVLTGIGTFVGLRGGDRYPTLVRKTEPKPIRIYMQDGSNDLNIYGGDWWMANQTMERALTFAGYDVNHTWGEGGHSGEQSTALFPDIMRWLWRDWPKPIVPGHSHNNMLNEILIPGQEWRLVGSGYRSAEGAVVDEKGAVFFDDPGAGMIYRIGPEGSVSPFGGASKTGAGPALPSGRRLYAPDARGIVALDGEGKRSVVARGVRGHGLVAASNGNLYVTGPGSNGGSSRVWLIRPKGRREAVETGLRWASGVTLSPDQTLLYVADRDSHWVYSYQIQPDGSLRYGQQYYWLHSPDTADDAGADGMTVDRDGRLYVATRLGIQVCDQAGRVNVILPTPSGQATSVCFGGAGFDTLFATCGDRVYARKLNVVGAPSWGAPNRPAPPGL